MFIGTQSLKKRLTTAALAALLLGATQLSLTSNHAFASYNYALAHYTWASSGANTNNAVDGATYDAWQPQFGGSGWITVDLDSLKSINQIVIKTPALGHIVQSVVISTSTDNITYVQQVSTTCGFVLNNNYTSTINLPSTISARYVRVSVANAGTATMIGELEVYGP